MVLCSRSGARERAVFRLNFGRRCPSDEVEASSFWSSVINNVLKAAHTPPWKMREYQGGSVASRSRNLPVVMVGLDNQMIATHRTLLSKPLDEGTIRGSVRE